VKKWISSGLEKREQAWRGRSLRGDGFEEDFFPRIVGRSPRRKSRAAIHSGHPAIRSRWKRNSEQPIPGYNVGGGQSLALVARRSCCREQRLPRLSLWREPKKVRGGCTRSSSGRFHQSELVSTGPGVRNVAVLQQPHHRKNIVNLFEFQPFPPSAQHFRGALESEFGDALADTGLLRSYRCCTLSTPVW